MLIVNIDTTQNIISIERVLHLFNKEWDESKHSRDKNGQFASKDGGSEGSKKGLTSKRRSVKLAPKEYVKVVHELNNNLSKSQRKKKRIKKIIGDYYYIVINHGFNEYEIIGRKKLNEID